jgi:hypothetical protein
MMDNSFFFQHPASRSTADPDVFDIEDSEHIDSQGRQLHIQYTYIVGKYKIYLYKL